MNVAWLIFLLNLTSVIAHLFGCSVMEKHVESQQNTRALLMFNDR